MKFIHRLSMLVGLMLLCVVPVLAQDSGLVPFSEPLYKISGVMPKDWKRVSPGVFARQRTVTDQTLLAEQAAPMKAAMLKQALQGQLGIKAFPEPASTLKTSALTWELFSVSSIAVQGQPAAAEIALAEANGTTYVIMLLATPDEVATLKIRVYLPAVNALAPLSGAAATESAAATPELATDEQEITFKSGDDTIYGTLLVPANRKTPRAPAVILIAGSGPTDRNGNSRLLPVSLNTLQKIARILADQGIVSLRYDKVSTGKTGLASFASRLSDIGFDLYVNEARDALAFISARPEVDPARVMLMGHSEGGLIALVVASQKPDSLRALGLVSGLSRPYLDTLREQLQAQTEAAVKAGTLSQADADQFMKKVDESNQSLLTSGRVPAEIPPSLQAVYNPQNAKFLAQVGQYDPSKLAAALPKTMPVLIECGEKDIQVLCRDVQRVADAFKQAGNTHATFVQLKGVNHVLQAPGENSKGAEDYNDSSLPFSQDFQDALVTFVKANLN